ncbi:helix-turn-helix transcriptional regulator [Halomonas sp. MA07-2]|uniref:helix-turn-helix transcriptional regulator n=1 Tax=Halomonas sp. MA07-2 TaxID=3440841 RepID=UPI003EEBE48A
MSMKLIPINEVIKRTSLAKSTIYKYMSLGQFPKSIKLGTRKVAWVESEIEIWIQSNIERRDEAV